MDFLDSMEKLVMGGAMETVVGGAIPTWGKVVMAFIVIGGLICLGLWAGGVFDKKAPAVVDAFNGNSYNWQHKTDGKCMMEKDGGLYYGACDKTAANQSWKLTKGTG